MNAYTAQAKEMIAQGFVADLSCAMLVDSSKELEAEMFGDFSEQRRDIVIVSCPDNRTATGALNEHDLE